MVCFYKCNQYIDEILYEIIEYVWSVGYLYTKSKDIRLLLRRHYITLKVVKTMFLLISLTH